MKRSNTVILLSIKPGYSKAIFSGEKTIELRKSRINISAGDTVIVYESSPTMAIVGKFDVLNVISSAPSDIWRKTRLKACINKLQYDNYFQGAAIAYGIVIANPKLLTKQIPLNSMREFAGLNPPQSFRYLTDEQILLLGLSNNYKPLKRGIAANDQQNQNLIL